jgi:putative ABC transport system permease protein
MPDLVRIAVRNLLRYRRRTLLTASLIAIGVVAVVVFVAAAGAFKGMMVGQITDAMLGHLQIHRAGYVASIDNLPLTLNLSAEQMAKVERALAAIPEVEASSPRVKFGGLLSNYVETTTVRLNGVDPDREFATAPVLPSRITKGEKTIRRGEVLLPQLLAAGLKIGVGDTVVIIATNREGSVNAMQLKIGGVIDSVTGPSGRDGYLHIDDARELLRMETSEVSEIAVRVKRFGDIGRVADALRTTLAVGMSGAGSSAGGRGAEAGGTGTGGPGRGFEVHTWEGLTPFYNVAVMIDVLTWFINAVLVGIVLVSVMNVMLMSVYERVREIGTIAAMGTLPGTIRAMFLVEGLALGAVGAVVGGVIAVLIVIGLDAAKVTFNFGQQKGLVLAPVVDIGSLAMVSVVVIVVAAVASLQPAFKASRMEPVEALRHG